MPTPLANTLKWYKHTSAIKAFKSYGKVGRFTKLHQSRHSWIGKNANGPCLFTHSKLSMFASRLIILRSFLSSEYQRRQAKKQWNEKEPCIATDFENDVAATHHQIRYQEVSCWDHWATLAKHPLRRTQRPVETFEGLGNRGWWV